MQHQQGSYPYPQYPGGGGVGGGGNLVRSVSSPVATKPVAYMNSMPRPGAGSVPSYPPVHQQHSGGPASATAGGNGGAGQGYPPPPPSRYPTPTLNQLLQPGAGVPVQRYPYGDYPQQQQQQAPNSHVAGWPMQQQPRNFSPGFKPPPNAMQQVFLHPSSGFSFRLITIRERDPSFIDPQPQGVIY